MSKNHVESMLDSIPEQWEAFKAHMENSVLPALQAGRPLTNEHIRGMNTVHSVLGNCQQLVNLASAKKQSNLESNPAGSRMSAPIHDGAQELVNEWLRDKCIDHDISDAAWESSHERFTFSHSLQITRAGQIEFSVPDRVKEMYEELSGNNFNDDLRELLVDECYNLDIDYEDGDTYDSCDDYELE